MYLLQLYCTIKDQNSINDTHLDLFPYDIWNEISRDQNDCRRKGWRLRKRSDYFEVNNQDLA